jgi:hypothetical protein
VSTFVLCCYIAAQLLLGLSGYILRFQFLVTVSIASFMSPGARKWIAWLIKSRI